MYIALSQLADKWIVVIAWRPSGALPAEIIDVIAQFLMEATLDELHRAKFCSSDVYYAPPPAHSLVAPHCQTRRRPLVCLTMSALFRPLYLASGALRHALWDTPCHYCQSVACDGTSLRQCLSNVQLQIVRLQPEHLSDLEDRAEIIRDMYEEEVAR